jgi:hypothetical protein
LIVAPQLLEGEAEELVRTAIAVAKLIFYSTNI